jgi:hypothetical protein
MTGPDASTMTVRAGVSARLSGDVDAVLASLPLSLHWPANAEARPDLIAVDGAVGWPTACLQALSAGVHGIVVVDPEGAPANDVHGLRRASHECAVPVVLDLPLSGNPGIDGAATQFATIDGPGVLLEARLTVPTGADLRRVLFDALGLVRRAVAPVAAATTLSWGRRGFVCRGRLGDGRQVLISVAVTDGVPKAGSLRLIGADRTVELVVPDPATALPAHLTVSTPEGALLLPTRYETAHRATWRRLHALVGSHARAAPDLDEFAADLTLANALTTVH